jgi:cell division protein FtsZ
MTDHQVAILDAFKQADQVLMQGVSGITDLITTPGLINLDFADVKSVMSNAGSALMGIGSARGDERARSAAELAVSSPLLEESIDGARGVLLSIAGGSDLGLFEVSAAADLIQGSAHEEANIIFGTVIDDALGDEVRVTVIAAGFDDGQPPRRQPGIGRAPSVRPGQSAGQGQAGQSPSGQGQPGAPSRYGNTGQPSPARQPAPTGAGSGAGGASGQPQPNSGAPSNTQPPAGGSGFPSSNSGTGQPGTSDGGQSGAGQNSGTPHQQANRPSPFAAPGGSRQSERQSEDEDDLDVPDFLK